MGEISSSLHEMPTRSVAAAAIVAGASLLGSIIGGISSNNTARQYRMGVDSTNATNIALNNANNQFNYDLYKLQYQNAVDFQNSQNLYNSPVEERNRLLQAGLNPSLAFGSSSSVGNVGLPSAIPSEAGHVEPAPFDAYSDSTGLIVSRGLSDALDNLSKLEDFSAKSVDNLFRFERNSKELKQLDAELSHRLASTDLSRVERAKLLSEKQGVDQLNRLNESRYDDMVQYQKLQNQFLATQDRITREQSIRDTERLALEKLRTRSGIALDASNQRYLSQLTQNAFNLDLRESDTHFFEQGARALDNALKRLQLSETEKQNLFNDVMRNTDLYHEGLKDASLINRVTERMFGLGFRDVGSALRALFR